MKALNKFFMGTTLAITLLGASVAWGDPSIVGGNVIVERPEVDTASNFYLIDTNHPLNADGMLDQWEIFAKATASPAAIPPPVRLVIYRQKGDRFFVVGKSKGETPNPGYNLFKLRPKIKVKAGDFVGAYYPNTGSISFSYDPPSSPNTSDFGNGNLTGTTIFGFPDPNRIPFQFTLSSNRHYSIRVQGESSNKK